MTLSKRLFDIFFAVVIGVLALPFLIFVAAIILICDGRPVFYLSERMRCIDQGFTLIKFRTMTLSTGDNGVTGGDKSVRITKTGTFLRKSRLDEIPQLWNVFRGDISFVGPRPPLRQYVERYPDLYRTVLLTRPGVTGLASIIYHKHEENLLSHCNTNEETDEVYTRVCIPRKAKIDAIYRYNQSLCFDCILMLKTVFRSLPLTIKYDPR